MLVIARVNTEITKIILFSQASHNFCFGLQTGVYGLEVMDNNVFVQKYNRINQKARSAILWVKILVDNSHIH